MDVTKEELEKLNKSKFRFQDCFEIYLIDGPWPGKDWKKEFTSSEISVYTTRGTLKSKINTIPFGKICKVWIKPQ